MQPPRKRRSPWAWYKAQTVFGKIGVGCLSIFVVFSMCICTASFASASQSPQAATIPTATATHQAVVLVATVAIPTDTPTMAIPTATPTQKPTPTAQPTPKPTPKPTPRPTPTPVPHHTGVNGNPWGYDFNPGNLIYNPPGDFCSYFNCIPNFFNGRGFVNECNDGSYSKSGGIRGDCSYHGGESRPLYSH